MRAISLWQPWATAVAIKLKGIETRHWTTAYRGPLAIHAAKRWDSSQRDIAAAIPPERHASGVLVPVDIPLGAIVALVNLTDIQKTEELLGRITEVEQYWGNYESGRYGWIFDNVRALSKPIPFKGAQGFFNVPDDLILA